MSSPPPILLYGEDDSLRYYLLFFATNPAITATAMRGVEKKNANTPFMDYTLHMTRVKVKPIVCVVCHTKRG